MNIRNGGYGSILRGKLEGVDGRGGDIGDEEHSAAVGRDIRGEEEWACGLESRGGGRVTYGVSYTNGRTSAGVGRDGPEDRDERYSSTNELDLGVVDRSGNRCRRPPQRSGKVWR